MRRSNSLTLGRTAALLLLPLAASPAAASICVSSAYEWQDLDIEVPELPLDTPSCALPGENPCRCFGFVDLTFCAEPTVISRSSSLVDPTCDPTDEAGSGCAVEIRVELEHPGNEQMIASWAPDPAPTPQIFWYTSAEAPTCNPSLPPPLGGCNPVAICGLDGAPGRILRDRYETTHVIGGVKCSNVGSVARSLTAYSCITTCRRKTDVDNLGGQDMSASIGCPLPPKDECGDCKSCPIPGAGANVGGGGPTVVPQRSGPGARLRYRAGGAGGPSLPGSVGWAVSLGRYWSHDYAQRIVMDPDETHVWLLTQFGSFREFSDLVAGTYTTNSPSDEYRTLTRTMSGWELKDLDGTVDVFEEVSGSGYGRWVSSTDRNGNPTVASYLVAGELMDVTFPDGRTELFAYHPDGKLASISEVGVDGSTTRTWSYTWAGNDLQRIDRPDSTAWEFFYTDPALPGYLTRQELVGTDGTSRRMERAWEYDASGNVTKTWRGDLLSTGPGAVGLWTLAPNSAFLPTSIDVTDPLGGVTTYTVDRDPASSKARVTQIDGGCPTCGLGPNSLFEYDDAANPLSPTAIFDGKGHRTEFSYDANGRVLTRIDAALEPEERTTTFQYSPDFPAFVTLVEVPSVAGGAALRATETTISPVTGDATMRRITGVESGSAFQHDTVTAYNAQGQPLTVDPPGYGTADVTSFTYDPARGNLLPLTRTDPLIGTTGFTYDPFNRRTTVEDPNAVATETQHDALDRIRFVIERQGQLGVDFNPGDPPQVGDLVTENFYNVFGDLERTVLPEGNVIVYEYDAAGRLESISRGPTELDLRERAFYTLDGFGNRTKEELQRFDTAWVTESETDFLYPTRCFLEEIVHSPGTPEESVTEYEYDCNGNLERVWDANHDSATDPPTHLYAYDALDRLTAITQPWTGAGAGNAITTYGYDVQDHLTSVTDAEGNQTTYVYSDRDLLTRQISLVSGQTDFQYNEHGELTQEIDARAVVVDRTVDELDRVTLVDYADNTLDTVFVYDDPALPFSKGRLTAIQRNGRSIDYGYDRFGRTLQDGALSSTYDDNGNRETIVYPGGVTATYTYDYADRHRSLTVDDGVNPAQTVGSMATYKPSGPLTSLELGNGLTETRDFDGRYFPELIDLAGGLGRVWDYSVVDKVGNVKQIDEMVACTPVLTVDNQTLSAPEVFEGCNEVTSSGTTIQAPGPIVFRAGDRVTLGDDFVVETGAEFQVSLDPRIGASATFTYDYQDQHYFLTQGVGPWGTLDYVYDKIGNRQSETRTLPGGSPVTDTYSYVTNASEGNTPILDSISLGPGGTRGYTYGPAGHLEEVAAGANVVDFTSNQAGRLSELDRLGNMATMSYDGRSFLEQVAKDLGAGDFQTTEPTYSSDGLLHALTRKADAGATPEQLSYFYLAGRPVAQLVQDGTTSTWTFLTADHLGTPFVATDLAGDEVWLGPLEPFGADFFAGTQSGATVNEIYLRFPGQWEDGTWGEASSGANLYYNAYRWYEPGTGRYGKADPSRIRPLFHEYTYVDGRPLTWIDSEGQMPALPNPSLPPLPPQVPCIGGAVARALFQGSLGPYGNRWAHCFASCAITKCAGTSAAERLGLEKEAIDTLLCNLLRKFGRTRNTFCDSAFQPSDFEDNAFGRECPENQSCDERCRRFQGVPDSPPGPFG